MSKASQLRLGTTFDGQAMEAFLRATLDPSLGCAEIRVLEASVNSRNKLIVPEETYKATIATWGDSIQQLCDQAARISGVSAYITVNAVNPALKARADRLTKSHATTTDKDITHLRWLFLDFDAIRPTGISSTQEELVKANAKLGNFLADHPHIEPSCLWGCSGNGYWCLIRLPDYPNDDEHRALIERAVDYFSKRHSDAEVNIDLSSKNPARVMPLVGTVKCKGVSTADRPHRMATMESPPDRECLPFELKAFLDSVAPVVRTPPQNGPAHHGPAHGSNGADVETRARRYVRKIDPAISGQKGHDKTFYAACRAGPGFDLSRDLALRIIAEEYNPRCQPPWSQKELEHKLDGAYAKEKRRGWLLNAKSKNRKGTAGSFVGFVSSPPEVRPISVELRPVPMMDDRLIPDPFRPWLKDIAERACCPLDIPAISAMTCTSAVVGRRVAIRPKRFDDWTVVPNLWGVAILPPGWLKTHCLDEPKRPLARLEMEARESHEQALKDFEVLTAVATAQAEAAKAELKDAARAKRGKPAATEAELRGLAVKAMAKPDLAPPTLRRLIVNDATVEKLGELLAENPHGLLCYRDELMGFLKSLEKQGHENDRAFYLEAWNGTGSYSYDRIGRGSLFIPSATVSILGGIQPGRLASYIRSCGSGENDDGLISRFQLAVYPDTDRPYQLVDRWPDTAAKNRAFEVFRRLASLDPAAAGAMADQAGDIPHIRFAPDAQDFFDDWFANLEGRVRGSQEAASLTAHLAKYRSLLPSLALLFHLIDIAGGVSSGPVSNASARRAAAWCEYLEAHARRIYQAAYDGDPEPAQRLTERLKDNLPNPFTARDVLRKGWKSLGSPEEVDRAIALAEAHGWICAEEVPSTETGGRPTTRYHTNPRVLK